MVRDDGGIARGGVDSVLRTFTVTIEPVNDVPTLDPIQDRTVDEDAGPQTVDLTGISAGPNETQHITVTATSSNALLIPDPTVSYTSPNPGGSLAFSPAANGFGSATITVTVRDDGGTENAGVDTFSRSFSITPIDDDLVEGAENVAISIQPDAAYVVGVPPSPG